jgi:hypothetical protein
LDAIIDINREYIGRFYKSDTPETANHYGSVIQTGYNDNGKPYTHPAYLLDDLPGQI